MTGKTGGMGDLLKALQKWLRRNKSEQTPRKPDDKRDRKERNWYSRKGWDGAQKEKEKEKVKPNCIFCEKDHCMGRRMRCFRHAYKTQGIFHEKCVSTAVAQVIERERECRSRGCFKCKARHHTSLCDQHNTVFTGYIPTTEEKSLPAIIPLKIEGVILWVYLDTGSGRNFISSDAVENLKLNPTRHESRHIVTVNSVKKQSLPPSERKG